MRREGEGRGGRYTYTKETKKDILHMHRLRNVQS